MKKGVIQDQDSFAKAQEQLSEDNIKSLPQIQEFFDKNYINIVEEWAQHQQEADDGRFRLEELEERGFKDLLIADREFWHFKISFLPFFKSIAFNIFIVYFYLIF